MHKAFRKKRKEYTFVDKFVFIKNNHYKRIDIRIW